MSEPKVHPLIGQRWSPRAFDPTRPVSRGKVVALIEAARWAPSSYNTQPWRFLVFDTDVPDALEKARACLSPGNERARKAPVLILGVAQVTNPARGTENRYARHDLGLATENFLLQAVAEGLVAHPMAGFDKSKCREFFRIPDGYEPWTMIALGYFEGSAEEAELERSRRTRLPLRRIAFHGKWDEPLPGESA